MPAFKQRNHLAEVLRQGITRSQDVQFLLHEKLRLISNGFLCIADVHYSSCEGDLLDRGAKGLRQADCFDDDVWSMAFGNLTQARSKVFACRVDQVGCTGSARGLQFCVVEIDGNRTGSPEGGASDRSESYAAASKTTTTSSAVTRPRATA